MSSRSVSFGSSSSRSAAPRNVDRESRKPKLVARPPAEQVDESASEEESEPEDSPLPVIKKSESSRFSSKLKKVPSRASRPTQVLEEEEPESAPTKAVEEEKVVSSTSFLLSASLHISPTSVTSFEVNSFVPDFHAFFFVLLQMQESVYRNEYFRRLVPNYNTLMTSIYYGILCIFQVCRARIAANVATRAESQFARRFEREFPLESLPVASPLVGFFETLGYVCPSKYFEYVVPALPDFSQLTSGNNQLRVDCPSISRIPWIPAMIALLNDISTNTNTEISNIAGTPYWTRGRTVYGIRFAQAAEYTKLALSAGWSPVLVDAYDDAGLTAHRNMLRRFGIPAAPADITNVAAFCGLTDNAPWSWFRRFATIAAHEASFFANPSNMSAVSPIGTPSLLIESYSVYNPTAIGYDQAEDVPYFGNNNAAFADARLKAFQRYGSDEDFRSGCVTQFLLGYSATNTAHRSVAAQGDWFSNITDNLPAANPAIRPTLPVAKFALDFENPLHLTNQIVQEVLYKVEGQRRN